MKTLKHWLTAIAAASLVLGIAACNNEEATSENGGAGGATSAGGAAVTSDVTGSYMVDMEALREQARQSMEEELEGATDEQRQMAEAGMAMMEQFIAIFETWKLEIKDDNSFSFSQSETEQLEGTWTLDGDQITLTPVRVMDGEDWEPVEDESAESMTMTWDASTQSMKMPMEEGADEQIVFKKAS